MLLRFVRAFDWGVKLLACVSCAALTVVVLLAVGSRAVNEPFIWTDEASRFLMIYVAMLGWVLASRKRLHIRVRFFHEMLPRRWWALSEAVMQIAIVIFGALLVIYGVELVLRNTDVEATTIPISMSWVYLPIVAGGLITTAQGLLEFLGASRLALDEADGGARR